MPQVAQLMLPGRLSAAEYAERHGVTPNAVWAWRKKGWISFSGKEGIDPDAADAELAKHRPPSADGSSEDGALAIARLAYEVHRARKMELGVQQLEGVLEHRDIVRATVFEQVRRTRNALMAIPQRVGARLDGAPAREVVRVVREEILIALRGLGEAALEDAESEPAEGVGDAEV